MIQSIHTVLPQKLVEAHICTYIKQKSSLAMATQPRHQACPYCSILGQLHLIEVCSYETICIQILLKELLILHVSESLLRCMKIKFVNMEDIP